MKTSVRERLIGEPLIGFQTGTGVVRMPSVKAGPNSETKPDGKDRVRMPGVMVLNSEIKS